MTHRTSLSPRVWMFAVCLPALACGAKDESPAGTSESAPDAATTSAATPDTPPAPPGKPTDASQPDASAGQADDDETPDTTGEDTATDDDTATSTPGGSTTTPTSTDDNQSSPDDLGAYPFAPSSETRGGTMTFTNVGEPGWWPRRLDKAAGDPACDYKDGTDTWGGHCCMTEHHTDSTELAPFDEEMTLILKAIDVKQLAVYQPTEASSNVQWQRVTAWRGDTGVSDNLWFTQDGDGSATFPGDLTHNDCVGYLTQAPLVDCSEQDYFCPDDPGILHHGFSGSKLIVFLGSMVFDDAGVAACNGDGAGHPGPWVALVASELVRDGGRKWNGACNCYSRTGSVGDGCGEINVFEVVMDDNAYSNREFASTGVRSFQAGHVGGAVCGEDCDRDAFPADADVVDACAQDGYSRGPELEVGGETDGCPVWRRPDGDRFFYILLDESRRSIQVGIVHPANIPSPAAGLLPQLPKDLERDTIDAMLTMRLPEP